MDIEKLFRKLMEEERKEVIGEPYGSNDNAYEAIKKFLDDNKQRDFEVGDRVERNTVGKRRYKFPATDQVAVVSRFIENPTSDHGDLNDMEICVAIAQDNFYFYLVDSRYYRKAGKSGNVFNFRPVA